MSRTKWNPWSLLPKHEKWFTVDSTVVLSQICNYRQNMHLFYHTSDSTLNTWLFCHKFLSKELQGSIWVTTSFWTSACCYLTVLKRSGIWNSSMNTDRLQQTSMIAATFTEHFFMSYTPWAQTHNLHAQPAWTVLTHHSDPLLVPYTDGVQRV